MRVIKKLLLVVGLFFLSCGGVVDTIPHTKVNFTIPIYATNLIHVGGHEYFTGGISGIVVYSVDMSYFCVYDRACPFDWEHGGYVIFDPADLQLKCEICGSTFNILNGYPMSNSTSNYFLKSYRSSLIDDSRLHVYN